MENLLGTLKRENKEREKRLIIADRKLISDMVAYVKTQKLCDYDVEQVRKKMIRNALHLYGSKKKNFRNVVGEDYREYCDKLCEGTRKMTTKEFLLSRSVTMILAFALMYAARLIDVLITGGSFLKAPVDINMGFITATLALMVGIAVTYGYVEKMMKETGTALTQKQSMGMLGILFVIVVVAALGGQFLSDIHLFNVTWWIPVVIMAALYAILKFFYIQYENQLAKEA